MPALPHEGDKIELKEKPKEDQKGDKKPEKKGREKVSTSDNKQIELAEEYLNRQDFEKARSIYSGLAKNEDNIPFIHKNYLLCLSKADKPAATESYLKKVTRNLPEIGVYRLDLALFYSGQKEDKKAAETIKKLAKHIAERPAEVEEAAKYALGNQHPEWSLEIFAASRVALRDNYLYVFEMANVYKAQGRLSPMLTELLSLSERDANSLRQIENTLQNTLTKPSEYDTLEQVLIAKTQNNALTNVYSELLLWLYVQRHDFNGAFIQARALDKRTFTEGMRCMELAKLCISNKDYPAAIKVLDYVTKEYANKGVYFQAQRLKINAQEELVKSTYPIDQAAVHRLIADYYTLNGKTDNKYQGLENLRNIALLYGTYLAKPDSAITILQQILAYPRADKQLADRCRLDLGDMYLLQGVFWEATLLYSQAEKNEKDSPISYDAKLRNARLSYFKGEFELAQEHLDVLKMATSREIANDAMNLSLLIQDNMAEDTTGKALQAYANVELLLFQHREDEAMRELNLLEKNYPKNSLSDEVLWLRARINKRIRRFDVTLENLDKILKLYPTDLYGDDALFLEATIYEEEKNDKAKAMDLYQQLLKQYPGSIFTAEARKRFRLLRGDNLHLTPAN